MTKILFLLLFCFIFSGCGLVTSDLNLFTPGNALPRASEEEIQKNEKAKSLIGKTKQDVIAEFGSKMRISKKTKLGLNEYMPGFDNLHPLLEKNLTEKSGINSYYHVDEVGYYRYDAGISIIKPDEYAVFFYFIDNVSVFVSGS